MATYEFSSTAYFGPLDIHATSYSSANTQKIYQVGNEWVRKSEYIFYQALRFVFEKNLQQKLIFIPSSWLSAKLSKFWGGWHLSCGLRKFWPGALISQIFFKFKMSLICVIYKLSRNLVVEYYWIMKYLKRHNWFNSLIFSSSLLPIS